MPRSVLLRLLAAVALALGAATALAGPASAHVSLTGTVPAADESLTTAPAQVELTYSDDLLEVGNAVQVTGPRGALTLEPLQVAERSLVQPLPADLPPGEYTVQWRAASGDGHPIEGSFAFTSTAAAPTSSAAAPSTSSTTSDATTSSAAPTSSSSSAPADPLDPAGGTDLPVWLGVPVALLVAGAVVAVVLRRRGGGPGAHA